MTEDEDVSAAVAAAFRAAGIDVREAFGRSSASKTPGGVRMLFSKDGAGGPRPRPSWWPWAGGDTDGLDLARAGVSSTERGIVQVDGYLRTSAAHVFAAGDVTGR